MCVCVYVSTNMVVLVIFEIGLVTLLVTLTYISNVLLKANSNVARCMIYLNIEIQSP